MDTVKYPRQDIITRRLGGMCKSHINYFNYMTLPELNNILIKGIWSGDDFCRDEKFLDCNYWRFTPYFNINDDKRAGLNEIGRIPEEMRELFGNQVINGKQVFVNGVSWRTSDSGHSSVDSLFWVYCAGDANFTFWDVAIAESTENSIENEYVQKWLKLFNKKFTLEYSGFRKPQKKLIHPHFYSSRDYESTVFKSIDGMNYPWKWCDPWVHDNPFVSQIPPSYNPDSNLMFHQDLSSIRVYDLDDKQHLYMNRVDAEDLVKGRNYHFPQFKLPYYCRFKRHIHKGKTSYEFLRMEGDTIVCRDTIWGDTAHFENGDLYMIVKKTDSNEII